MLQLRLLPPRSYRARNRFPEYEVVDESGAVAGWIKEHALPGAGSRFFGTEHAEGLDGVLPLPAAGLAGILEGRDDVPPFGVDERE